MTWLPDVLTGLRDIVIVIFLGYGVKLLRQQIDLLEREKSLKQTEINLHKASIEHLKAQQAPAIACDLKEMIQTADSYAEQKRTLEEQLETQAREHATAKAAMRAIADASHLIGIYLGRRYPGNDLLQRPSRKSRCAHCRCTVYDHRAHESDCKCWRAILNSGNWTISLSTTSADWNTLSSTFATNLGADNTLVFSGNLASLGRLEIRWSSA